MIVLLTGGSGCGKSTYAEKIIAALPREKRVYIATMQVYDQESVKRVQRHRAQRANKDFQTIECPQNLSAAGVEEGSIVLLEDLPNLLANEMFDGGDWERIAPALTALAEKCAHLVIVTNDVFADGVSYDGVMQDYLKRLAFINSHAAEMADYAAEVVYSIPITLKGEAPCI